MKTLVRALCLSPLILIIWAFRTYGAPTSIVAIRTPDFVVVAADSAGTFEGRGNPVTIKPVCKIQQAGRVLFAVSGFLVDPVTRFDVFRVVKNTKNRTGNVHGLAKAATAKLLRLFPQELKVLSTADPEAYGKIVGGRQDASAVLFFGIENRKPIAVAVGFEAVLSSNGSIQVSTKTLECPGPDCPNGVEAFYLGSHEAIERYVHSAPQQTIAVPENFVSFLVQLEIAEHPDSVQGPIDVMRVDANGAKWIHVKSRCSETQNNH